MANAEKLKLLKDHIQELSAEIALLKRSITPQMSPQEYRSVYEQYRMLNNLKIIARNELHSLMHLYKVTLSGSVLATDSSTFEKVIRRRIETEIDCNMARSKNLDRSIPAHRELYDLIETNFSRLFENRIFRIKTVIQVK